MKKILLMLFFIPFLFLALKITGVRLNYTNSMPIGFYKKTHAANIKDGDLVAVCLPNHIADIGLKNHYIAHGTCSNGSTPILKKVIAIAGDSVSVNNYFMTVNGLSYPAPRLRTDRRHQAVQKIIQNGYYPHTQFYWLYGANDPSHSWDSRYYGGVSRDHIIGTYKPLLTL